MTAADSNAASGGKTNRNAVRATLRNPVFEANPAGNLLVLGAHGNGQVVAGAYNDAVVAIFGGSKDLVVLVTDSDPPDATNHAALIRYPGR